MNVFASGAYHVARAECESSGFGVLYADSHGSKLGRVEITVDEFLCYVSEIEICESEGKGSDTILYVYCRCV